MSRRIKHLYQFGAFAVHTDQRVLLREGKPLPLAPKVFETLLILVRNSGRIVGKEELISRLWPDTFVEESNLTFNIQQLRKVLGDNARKPIYVETIARRGYRFIADVKEIFTDDCSGQVSERNTGDAKPQEIPGSADDNLGSVEVGPSTELLKQDHQAAPVERLAGEPMRPAASSRVNKSWFALEALLALVLLGVGFLVWKFAIVPSGALDRDRKDDAKSSKLASLKLEKLTETGQSRHAAISPDGKYVAYTRAFGLEIGIWLRQLATNTNFEIVPPAGLIYALAFANSGEYLYFVRGEPAQVLYRVSSVGGVPTKIADRLDGSFSLSSDDSRVAFVRPLVNRDGQREYSLVIAATDGGNERTLSVLTYPNMINAPIWSPDDQSIICACGNWEGGGQDVRIVAFNVATGKEGDLSPEKFFRIRKMAWLPHKDGLIICARKNLGGDNQLWRVSYPGIQISQITEGLSPYLDLSIAARADVGVASQATRISDIWAGPSRDPGNLKRITQATDEFCWTPNGRLVYPSTASGNWDLWITQPDSTEQRQLTNDPGVDKAPTVTRDNRYIVFTSNRTGELQLWRMNIDGSNQTQLTNRGPADHPAISLDGKWVVYNTTDDWHLWRISIEGGEPVPLAEYTACFPAVSPDGKMIACLERNEPKSEFSIGVLPFDGGQPLKTIDFVGGGLSGTRIQWVSDGKALIYAAERNGPTALIKQSLDGGPPQEIMDFGSEQLFDFGYSFDAKLLAVTRGVWQHDIVLISDLDFPLKSP